MKLLLPQQVKEEVERDRCRKWPEDEIETMKTKIKSLESICTKAEEDLAKNKLSSKKIRAQFEKEIQQVKKDCDRVNKVFTNNSSKPNQKLKALFAKAQFIEENEKVFKNAQRRHQKGNPPCNDAKIGDALIWESLLCYLSESSQVGRKAMVKLIFVANDPKAWGRDVFDPWLKKEFKERAGGVIIFSKKISDISDLTKEEREKIREKEIANIERNATVDIIGRSDFSIFSPFINLNVIRPNETISVSQLIGDPYGGTIIRATDIAAQPSCRGCNTPVFSCLSSGVLNTGYCSMCQNRMALGAKMCNRCGKLYASTVSLLSGLIDDGLCEECKEKDKK